MTLEQQLLVNMEWSSDKNYWSTRNEVRTTIIDLQGMNLEQQLLINREWSWTIIIDLQGMKLEQQLLINREWS